MHPDNTPSPAEVIMYTTSWCPSVRAARHYLEKNGVKYTEVDIDRDPAAARQLESWTGGYRTVPTFDVGGTIVIDFNLRELRAALRIGE